MGWSTKVQCKKKCKHPPKQRSTAGAAASLLPQQVEHYRLEVVAEGAHGRHQPVGAETGVHVHHTFGHVHLPKKTNTVTKQCKPTLPQALVLFLVPVLAPSPTHKTTQPQNSRTRLQTRPTHQLLVLNTLVPLARFFLKDSLEESSFHSYHRDANTPLHTFSVIDCSEVIFTLSDEINVTFHVNI